MGDAMEGLWSWGIDARGVADFTRACAPVLDEAVKHPPRALAAAVGADRVTTVAGALRERLGLPGERGRPPRPAKRAVAAADACEAGIALANEVGARLLDLYGGDRHRLAAALVAKRAFFFRTLGQIVRDSLGHATAAPTGNAALSRRELQVLRMLGAGRTVKDVAARIGISEKTVSTYRSRLLAKLSLRTTAELIRHAIANGLA